MKGVLYAVLFLLTNLLYAQQGVLSSGGDGNSSSGSVSYSIGQIDYQAIDHSSGHTNEGLQVPYEIYLEVGIEEEGLLNARLYPNPTQNEVILELGNIPKNTLHFQLLDMNGRVLESAMIKEERTILSLSNYSAATYLLRITEGETHVMTYRIVKNH